MSTQICVVPFFGKGHLFPSIELCNHLACRNFHVTLIISSTIATSLPSSLQQNPLLRITQIPSSPSPHPNHDELAQGLEKILSSDDPNPFQPVCAIVDVMMSWSVDVFKKFHVPTVAFFTSGACSSAMEVAIWKAQPLELKPGEIRLLPGLPEDMAVTYSDLKQRPHGPPPAPLGGGPPQHGFPPPPPFGPRHGKRGPPKLGDEPMWIEEVQETVALMMNTCDDLERPFIDYIVNHIGKPVWGVGPLLPKQYWESNSSLVHDRDVRSNRGSNVTEEEVIQWLDSKPRGSVIYVSFGTEVGPNMEECQQLALALEFVEQPFIWVLQPSSGRTGPPRGGPGSWDLEAEEGYFPHGLDSRVGNRGLIIRGWAPQLLILSHPSIAGFLSHCGWNSTVEAIARGVPLLAWPIRGDQFHDAKFAVAHLKLGYAISDDLSETITADAIAKGIQKLMNDKEMKNRAEIFSAKFQNGFPRSSMAALDAFKDYVHRNFM